MKIIGGCMKKYFIIMLCAVAFLSIQAAEGDYYMMISSTSGVPDNLLIPGDVFLDINGTKVTGYQDSSKLIEAANGAFKESGPEKFIMLSYGKTREVNATFSDDMSFNLGIVRETYTVSTKKASDQLTGLLKAMDNGYVKYDGQDYKAAKKYLTAFMQTDLSKKENLDLRSLVRKLACFFSLLNDGHAGAMTTQLSDAFSAGLLLGNDRFLPLHVEIMESGVYMKPGHYSDKKAKILEINGVKIESILEELVPMASGDTVQNKMDEIADNFQFFYYLAFGSTEQARLKLRALSREEEITLKGVTYQDVLHYPQTQLFSGKPVEMTRIGDVAVLKLMGFWKEPWFKESVDKCFSEIRTAGIHKLVIDLRQNGGGHTDGLVHLLSRISDRNFKFWEANLDRCSKEARDDGIKFDDDLAIGESRRYTHEAYTPTAEKMFTGEVRLLVGRKTFSTAFDCAVCFSAMKLGTIIGSNTGGNNNSTEKGFKHNLEFADIQTSIPYRIWINVDTPAYDSDLSLKPDIYAVQSESDYLQGTDTVLNKALKSFGQ
ncbi:MAG: S41 family peptidase [Candidatus Wallbacteria bacterium]|nr:S41 family peptidase [Candidatus Wallbacteria bacterium]